MNVKEINVKGMNVKEMIDNYIKEALKKEIEADERNEESFYSLTKSYLETLGFNTITCTTELIDRKEGNIFNCWICSKDNKTFIICECAPELDKVAAFCQLDNDELDYYIIADAAADELNNERYFIDKV